MAKVKRSSTGAAGRGVRSGGRGPGLVVGDPTGGNVGYGVSDAGIGSRVTERRVQDWFSCRLLVGNTSDVLNSCSYLIGKNMCDDAI